MNVTKSIKFAKYRMRVYNIINKDVKEIMPIFLNNTTLKEIKNELGNHGLALLEIISVEHYTKKYSMDVNEFIGNATEIKAEKGE